MGLIPRVGLAAQSREKPKITRAAFHNYNSRRCTIPLDETEAMHRSTLGWNHSLLRVRQTAGSKGIKNGAGQQQKFCFSVWKIILDFQYWLKGFRISPFAILISKIF